MQGLETTAQVYKRQRAGGTGQYPATPDFAWRCHLLPISKRLELREGLAKSSHEMIGGFALISEGDRINVGSDVYFVQGVMSRNTPTSTPHHIEVFVSKRE